MIHRRMSQMSCAPHVVHRTAKGDHFFTDDDKLRRRLRREECIPNPCNMWGSWVPITQCNASCGGGIQRLRRNCSCKNGKYNSIFGNVLLSFIYAVEKLLYLAFLADSQFILMLNCLAFTTPSEFALIFIKNTRFTLNM